MDRSTLEELGSIIDPIERARRVIEVMTDQQVLFEQLANIRRIAIEEARASGTPVKQIAEDLGVTAGRISQMVNTRGGLVVTGWFLPSDSPEYRLAICGSRSSETDSHVIDGAITALAGLLLRHRCRVSHGPLGVGVEVMTHIADQHRPPGLGEVTGIIGHANVVRPADYVLVIGGGTGTLAEVDLAISMGKQLIPMAASGGTAARLYARQQEDERLRAHIPDDAFDALEKPGADAYVRAVELTLTKGTSR